MAKFSGHVGYASFDESAPGVYSETVLDRKYVGDITRISRSMQTSQKINDDLYISNIVSIVADAYAYENMFAIRYVTWFGQKWKVVNVEVNRPRLILTLGGVYNDG